MNYHWDWSVFWSISTDGVHTWAETFMFGLGWTLATAMASAVIAFTLGSLVGMARTLSSKWVSVLANSFVELFRNIPLLVQLFLWFFVFPELLPTAMGAWMKSQPDAPFLTSVIGLGFFTAARVAVQVSSGIQSLPRGQRLAGMALGFTTLKTYGYVLLPQAYRIIFPTLTSELIVIIKNSSVALTIGLMELMARANELQEMTFQSFESLTAVTLIYLLLNGIVIVSMHFVENKFVVPGYIHSKINPASI